MKQKNKHIVLLILSLLALPLLFIRYEQNLLENGYHKSHILGGFSLNTQDRASNAAADGVQVAFYYGEPPAENSQLGQKLQALHMQVVDGFISSYMYYYECHRTKTVKPPPAGITAYCVNDYHPELNTEDAVLAAIAAHLQRIKNNHLVSGYWVLDDWVPWDTGSARGLLARVHLLIQHYTPGRPAICGFGGFFGKSPTGTGYGWLDALADNFSPQGCDMVGLYIYTPAPAATIPATQYDWSMAQVLPAMFTSLAKRGWDISREPLIGIVQAFGGPRLNTNLSWARPSADDLVTQSKSFCEHGASGLVYYGWNDSTFGPGMQTPMNNAGIETGIRQGIAACQQIWSSS